jgi:hypothetical protein
VGAAREAWGWCRVGTFLIQTVGCNRGNENPLLSLVMPHRNWHQATHAVRLAAGLR